MARRSLLALARLAALAGVVVIAAGQVSFVQMLHRDGDLSVLAAAGIVAAVDVICALWILMRGRRVPSA